MCFPHSGRRGEEEATSRRKWNSNRLVQVEFSNQTGLNCLNGVSVNFLFYADLLIFIHVSFILCILVQIGFAAALLNAKVNIMLIAVHYHVLIWVNPL